MKILIRNDKKETWKLVESAAYKGESELQHLLGESPSLISIEEIREGSGQLVVAIREFPLPIGSLDLLAFSATGDMTLIECKLASNAEIKRKVIGQALEYGSHLWQMSYDELDQKIQERTKKSLADLMHDVLGNTDWDEEAFRANVSFSLETGSFILMIVVDEINEDLSRIIRFVNTCGQPAFSFAALEMRRFQSEQTEMLVPRVVGNTQKADTVLASGRRRWTETSFFNDAEDRLDPSTIQTITSLYKWSKEHANSIRFGTGSASGSFTFVLEWDGKTGSVFSVYTGGTITINFGYMEKIFSPEEISSFRQELSRIATLTNILSPATYYYSTEISSAFPNHQFLNEFQEIILQLIKLHTL